jgi:hypothetical protein
MQLAMIRCFLAAVCVGASAWAAPAAGEETSATRPVEALRNEARAVIMLSRFAASQDAHAALKKAFATQPRDLARDWPEESPKLDAEGEARAKKLIADLGANDFEVREKATAGIRSVGKAADYALCAVPAVYGGGCRKTFIINSDGRPGDAHSSQRRYRPPKGVSFYRHLPDLGLVSR